jgi:membrane associated rhomboid family serine protease
MIPLRDDNPSRSIPIVNIGLILSNLVVFVYQHYYAPGDVQMLFYRFGFVPYEFFHFIDTGLKNGVGAPFTIFTAMFMHAGWLHLLGNMLYLWIFGDNIEDTLGHRRYLFFYAVCGIAATLIHGVFNVNSKIPTVGASGAIAGVLGAYMLRYPRARIRVLLIFLIFVRIVKVPALTLLGVWMLLQIFGGINAQTHVGIAWFAHIGGFLTGCLLMIALKKK